MRKRTFKHLTMQRNLPSYWRRGGGIPVECQVGTLLDGDGKFV